MNQTIQEFLAELLGVEAQVLAPQETVDDVLRRRLTKKERKMLHMLLEAKTPEAIMAELSAEADRYEAIKEALFKKIRHPKIRNELIREP